ncbi:lasso peptide biosynthesis B2 protein [Halieaceae bacterium IMCC14734]|uniref:Lasso peptide biosynthesis B2 protein n=1 Tax=Candidatus Litorirhabdus singularis TaxID=2518993 RepID=A0ABT3TDK8_9GAMM|nr:lasso peptide biosynthesis B2 protein [Candidatus Litorirhabdus singularis]MCX2980392.1 lasso peptide biosynthesis B2 protein [Candidatus Litorirhabdus singularis]
MNFWQLQQLQWQVIGLTPLVALLVRCLGWRRCQRFLLARPQRSRCLAVAPLSAVMPKLEPTRWYRGPLRPRCLTRSLTLQAILARHGVLAEMRVGVARKGSQLFAHAWLEREGTVLNESQLHTGGFTVMAGLDVDGAGS